MKYLLKKKKFHLKSKLLFFIKEKTNNIKKKHKKNIFILVKRINANNFAGIHFLFLVKFLS